MTRAGSGCDERAAGLNGEEIKMAAFNRRHFSISFAVATLALMVSGKVMTDTESGYVVDHGIAVYYATIPAEIIRGHAKEHPEATMHGGIPRPRHAYL